jgi:hypothetical protein
MIKISNKLACRRQGIRNEKGFITILHFEHFIIPYFLFLIFLFFQNHDYPW